MSTDYLQLGHFIKKLKAILTVVGIIIGPHAVHGCSRCRM